MLPIDIIRIIHVDDETTQLKLAKIFIEKIDPGMKVMSTSSPREVINLLDGKVDCIVSDYQMPVLNGIDLAKEIRPKSNIPIILYTGRGSEDVAVEAFAAGVDDYVKKEVDPTHYQVLAKSIRTSVEKYWAEDELYDSEKRYKTLVESSPNAILVTIDDEIVYCNRKLADLLCVENPSGLIGQNPLEYIDVENRTHVLKNIDKLGNVETISHRVKIINRKTEQVNVLVTSSNIDWSNERAQLHILQNIEQITKHQEKFSCIERGLSGLVDDINILGDSLEPSVLNSLLGKIEQIRKIM